MVSGPSQGRTASGRLDSDKRAPIPGLGLVNVTVKSLVQRSTCTMKRAAITTLVSYASSDDEQEPPKPAPKKRYSTRFPPLFTV